MREHPPEELAALWDIHRNAPWPGTSGANEGPLMTLDTVISGCVTYYFESEEPLDQQRVEMLEGCLQELAVLFPELPHEVREYFDRLERLGSMLLATHRA